MTHTNTRSRPLGRRRTDKSRPVITLPLTSAVLAVPHPAAADHLAQVTTWNGRTNISFGTCGPCDTYNGAIMTWKYLLGLDITGTDKQVFDLYRRSGNPNFDPAAPPDANGNVPGDNGVDMTVMLSEVVRNGIAVTHSDGGVEVIKPLCFAAAPTGIDDVRAVTSIFGGSSLAWDLDTAQQAQTNAGLWDYQASPAWGGHATFGGAYTSSAAVHSADEEIISWMQKVGTTDSFVAHQLAEHYAVVWKPLWDHPAFQAGVDKAALAAAFTAETGRPFPAVVPPAPTPVPVPPAPVPVPPVPPAPEADPDVAYGFDKQMIAWAARPHAMQGNAYAARQYNAWRAARGYVGA